MPSIDYPGQAFNAITFENSLDDSESAQVLIGSINFENSLDDSESGQALLNSIIFASDLDDSEFGSAKDNLQHESSSLETGGGGGPGITTYYAMRAIDPDCPTLTYVAWVVTGNPDSTGVQYVGPRCGASPLSDITITAKWQE